jgi:hypothetical protein
MEISEIKKSPHSPPGMGWVESGKDSIRQRMVVIAKNARNDVLSLLYLIICVVERNRITHFPVCPSAIHPQQISIGPGRPSYHVIFIICRSDSWYELHPVVESY